MLTIDEVRDALPANLKSNATQGFVDTLNNISVDPDIGENIRENFITYTKILQDGKFKTDDYLNAVAYVSYKHMGWSNQDAWSKTFPARHNRLIGMGASTKDISAHVAMYHKTKLVNLIMEQTLVPFWILNQDNYQKAINAQVKIMEDDTLPAVARAAAANSIMTHLQKPKEAINGLTIQLGESDAMKDLKSMMLKLAQNQQAAIAAGMSPREIASQKIFEGEFTEVKP